MVSFLKMWETGANVSAVDYYAAYDIVVFPLPHLHLSPLSKKTGKIHSESAFTAVNGDQLKVLKLA
jgi:hypothetical protein